MDSPCMGNDKRSICRGVYGTGFETTFTIDLPGFGKAEKTELEKAANELFLDIAKG